MTKKKIKTALSQTKFKRQKSLSIKVSSHAKEYRKSWPFFLIVFVLDETNDLKERKFASAQLSKEELAHRTKQSPFSEAFGHESLEQDSSDRDKESENKNLAHGSGVDSTATRITNRDGKIVIIRGRKDNELEENLLIDEEHRRTRFLSYRWLIFNAVLQSVCFLTIITVIFLDFIVSEDDGKFAKVGILHMESAKDDDRVSVFKFAPGKNPCSTGTLVQIPNLCQAYKKIFWANMTLLVFLIISMFFDAAAVYSLARTIRTRSSTLNATKSGLATLFTSTGFL